MKPYYSHGGITIYHGDCREILPELVAGWRGPFAVIVDPPYGIKHSSNGGPTKYSRGAASWAGTKIQGDESTELRDWIVEFFPPCPMAIFGSWKMPRPAGVRQVLIWDKGPQTGMGDVSFPWKPSFEEIYILGDGWSGRRDEAVLRGYFVMSLELNGKGRNHPHEKPVSLMKHILGKTDRRIIIDPCCGIGSSLIAAKQLGKDGWGIEIEERYCEIAVKKLSQEVFQFEVKNQCKTI